MVKLWWAKLIFSFSLILSQTTSITISGSGGADSDEEISPPNFSVDGPKKGEGAIIKKPLLSSSEEKDEDDLMSLIKIDKMVPQDPLAVNDTLAGRIIRTTQVYTIGASVAWRQPGSIWHWNVKVPDFDTWNFAQRQNFLQKFPHHTIVPSLDEGSSFVYKVRTMDRIPPVKFVQKLLTWMIGTCARDARSSLSSTALSIGFDMQYVWTLTVHC